MLNIYDNFEPSLDDVEKLISEKTKAIVINSPNNPVGATYSSFWMKGFGELMKNHDHVFLLSDEIYFNVYRNGAKIGYHKVEFNNSESSLKANIEIKFEVTFLGFTV